MSNPLKLQKKVVTSLVPHPEYQCLPGLKGPGRSATQQPSNKHDCFFVLGTGIKS